MSRNYSRAAADDLRKRRRRNSLLLSAAAVVAIIALLATEQVALLYLLATLGVSALLLVVAFADLHGAEQLAVPAPADDAAAIADRSAERATSTANASYGGTAPRRPKRRQRR